MMFANLLSVATGGRFTVGWLTGRLSWLVSACVLFIYLMVLHPRDQRLRTWPSALLLGAGEEGVAERSGQQIMPEAIPAIMRPNTRRDLPEPRPAASDSLRNCSIATSAAAAAAVRLLMANAWSMQNRSSATFRPGQQIRHISPFCLLLAVTSRRGADRPAPRSGS
jgi:hypothetical protein